MKELARPRGCGGFPARGNRTRDLRWNQHWSRADRGANWRTGSRPRRQGLSLARQGQLKASRRGLQGGTGVTVWHTGFRTPPLGAPLPTLLPRALKVLLPPIYSFFNPLLSDYHLHALKTCLRSPVTFLLSHWGLFNALIWDILMLLNTPSWKMPHPTAVWLLRHNIPFLSLLVLVVFS